MMIIIIVFVVVCDCCNITIPAIQVSVHGVCLVPKPETTRFDSVDSTHPIHPLTTPRVGLPSPVGDKNNFTPCQVMADTTHSHIHDLTCADELASIGMIIGIDMDRTVSGAMLLRPCVLLYCPSWGVLCPDGFLCTLVVVVVVVVGTTSTAAVSSSYAAAMQIHDVCALPVHPGRHDQSSTVS